MGRDSKLGGNSNAETDRAQLGGSTFFLDSLILGQTI